MDTVNGPRLWWIVVLISVSLLLSSLESTIVSTALVTIAADFDDYQQSNWVIIAYLVTYSAFLIIYSRLSDLTGRKAALITGLSVFTIASLACGLAGNMTQLIVFRVLQGIGGSGIFALAMVIVAEMTPLEQVGLVGGLVGIVFVVASAVGPVVGGAITSLSTWRWCFWFNVPSGALIVLLVGVAFPKQAQASTNTFKRTLARIDWFGCVLCVASSILVVVPLQLGGDQVAWNSPVLIVLFALGGIFWLSFACWETWLAFRPGQHVVLPILPVKVAVRRVIAACIVTALLTGLGFTSSIIYIPQRFQVEHGLSPVQAGIKMIPMVVISAVANIASGIILKSRNVCAYLILVGNALQLLGCGLNSSLENTATISTLEYVYQAILGLGFGTTLNASFVLARIEVRREEIAAIIGAITQLRVFGGVVGVALCRAALASYVNNHLSDIVSAANLKMVMSSVESIERLPPRQIEVVRQVYGDGFRLQWRVLMYIAAANVILCGFCFRRHPTPLPTSSPPSSDPTEPTQADVEAHVQELVKRES